MTHKGHLVAFALAGLFAAAGCGDKKAEGQKGTQANVKCMGVNACAGQGGCKTADNACKGKNGCKGHGMLEMSAEECSKKGGKTM